MLVQCLTIILASNVIQCAYDINPFLKLLRGKRAAYDDDDDIYMFRNPNVTIPPDRTRISFRPEWLYYTMQHVPTRATFYYGQKGLTKEYTTYAWFNDRITVYLDTFLKGLKNAPSTKYPRFRLPPSVPTTTTLSSFEQMTLCNSKDNIFKLPWAFLPHQNFRKEMGFGPNDTIDMAKVKQRTIDAFEKKYNVTVMYQWPNTHPGYLRYLNLLKWNYTLVYSGEMSTKVPLNFSYVNFEDWFYPQVPKMKLAKVENLEYQVRVLMDEQFELANLDKHIFVDDNPHHELVERYHRFRRLRRREYRTWYRRKIYLPWKHLVRDGIREWFFNKDKCVPSPGQVYFGEINKQFEQLSDDLNETFHSYFYEMDNAFLHWYSNTYAPKWNLSLEDEPTNVYTLATMYSPVTQSDEIYLYEATGVLVARKRDRRNVHDENQLRADIVKAEDLKFKSEPGGNFQYEPIVHNLGIQKTEMIYKEKGLKPETDPNGNFKT